MNETINTMLTRRSIRSFEDKQVNEADIEQIVEAGLYAPSGMNCQTPIIIAITDKKTRKEIAEQNAKIMGKENCDPFYGAPFVLLVIAEKSPLSVYDGSCVIENMMNAAHSLGLGSCWIHRAKEEIESDWGKSLLKKLGINNECVGIGHVAVGYVKGEYPDVKPRKSNRYYRI